MIPSCRSTIEEAVWAAEYVLRLHAGDADAWQHANAALEHWRDDEQCRRIASHVESEEGPAHV